MILSILLCFLILAIIIAGAYYAAHYIVQLRHSRNILVDEYKRAMEHIAELESRINMLEADRDTQAARMATVRKEESSNGWEQFGVRN